jgi:hypothetical protein
MTNAAIGMMKDLASANTWRLIKDYIADYTDVQMIYNTPEEVAQDEELSELDDDDDDSSNMADDANDVKMMTSTAVYLKSNHYNDPDPQVVWLLSFPNSVRWYC